MPEIYSEPLRRRYFASRCSCAYAFYLACAIVLIILPFFMAFTNAPNFWLKTSTYREQPRVVYEYKTALLLEGFDRDGAPMSLFSSSMNTLNNLYESSLRIPVLRSAEVDANRDGLTDRVHLNAMMPLHAGESVHSATLLLFFDVRLRKRAKLQMETLAFVSHSSPLAGQALFVDGDLELRQRWPLQVKGGYQQPYDDTPLIDPTTTFAARDFLLPSLLQAYCDRNHTTEFASRYSVWSPSTGRLTDGSPTSFNMSATLRIPVADVLYTPTVTEVLKAAWIKYASMFVIVIYLLDKLLSFTFYNQLVECDMHVEMPLQRDGVKFRHI